MTNCKYFGMWNDRQDILDDFFPSYATQAFPSNFPSDDEIILAFYTSGGYDGSAFVVYRQDGRLYEVNGGHCSCYGLEDQWKPEETSVGALKMRKLDFTGYGELDQHDKVQVDAILATLTE